MLTKIFSWRGLRIASQWLFLLFFLFLFLETEGKGADELGWPVRLFLDFNPLILLTTLLSAQSAPVAFFLSLLMVAVTLLLGRVFCGWICPFGTLHNLVSQTAGRARALVRHPAWFKIKYYILVVMLGLALLGSQQAGLLDPISLLIRSLSVSIYPAFSLTASALFDALYHADLRGITAISERFYSLLRDTVLPFQQGFFRQSVFIGLLFIGLLALNLYERRFWCRYLCPLGALLGLLARWSLLRREVAEGCTNCGACGRNCPGGAEPRSLQHLPAGLHDAGRQQTETVADSKEQARQPAAGWRRSECHACFNCDDLCPHNLVKFKLGRPILPWGKRATADLSPGLDLGRRRLVGAAVAGMAMVPLMRVGNLPEARANPKLIRPPGSVPEKEFLSRCVKCGECMKVCLTGGLQPTLLEAGVEGLWTPLLVPRMGYCEYHCTLCGQVCPTGAIRRLSVEEKTEVKIGLAMFDRNRCLPWAYGIPCIVCEEVCPTPKKAIWFEEVEVLNRDGEPVRVQRPHVDLELCIGCGICETLCPVTDKPAIYVTSIGESRSRDNQLLL
ncbi:4Fe-4S binding protein [Desulfurivibrio alkaliphilus]|uniref:4Fe-4S ferredoxin iron-sulfur binding domain protein n=1 Tax=Desulfurivibrio alkaliphilus (strain DSM 19089 / UNIQEM U267 / AHT2) TaxID=589865 RepID=D6Z1E9_DESAT|nr:4Fe-4S binding protein [Desulfurivibrio alkaliphilus]ADH85404.1 4Fe-4S ferredoxin iron-sulfur binding domain protein [Desulfurivibrio alkaliphilus AHT 2]